MTRTSLRIVGWVVAGAKSGLITVALFTETGGTLIAQDEPTVETIGRGVLARATALASGRIEYHIKTGFQHTGQILNDEDCAFAWQDGAWVKTTEGPPGFRIVETDRGGNLLERRQTSQSDGSVTTSLRVGRHRDMHERNPRPPTFVGTVVYSAAADYIRNHLPDGQIIRREVVGDLTTWVIEWPIKASDQGAFGARGPLIVFGTDSVLRLYVAPSIGYCLPRIEYVGHTGQVANLTESSDFRLVADGIYVPFASRNSNYTEDGIAAYFEEYAIRSFTLVNQPIPNDEFELHVPQGTGGMDERSGKSARPFVVGETTGVPGPFQSPKETPWLWWKVAAALGIVLGLMTMIYCVRRIRTRSRTA